MYLQLDDFAENVQELVDCLTIPYSVAKADEALLVQLLRSAGYADEPVLRLLDAGYFEIAHNCGMAWHLTDLTTALHELTGPPGVGNAMIELRKNNKGIVDRIRVQTSFADRFIFFVILGFIILAKDPVYLMLTLRGFDGFGTSCIGSVQNIYKCAEGITKVNRDLESVCSGSRFVERACLNNPNWAQVQRSLYTQIHEMLRLLGVVDEYLDPLRHFYSPGLF